MEIDLDFDEAMYIYKELSLPMFPNFISFKDRLDNMRESEMFEAFRKKYGEDTDKAFVNSILRTLLEDDQWIACQFYARIIPKLLKAFPEIYQLSDDA